MNNKVVHLYEQMSLFNVICVSKTDLHEVDLYNIIKKY